MSNSSKTFGSSSVPGPEADLRALRAAWKDGKAATSEVENRIISKLAIDQDGALALEVLDLKALKKDAGQDNAGNQKQRILNSAVEPILLPLAEDMRATANNYLSPAAKNPKATRNGLAANADYILPFLDALPDSEAAKYLIETWDLAELLLSHTKAPPSEKFASGRGSSGRIHKLLSAAGAGEPTANWASMYLGQAIRIIPNREKRADAIANAIFISKKHAGNKPAKKIRQVAHEALWDALSSHLIAEEDGHFPALVQLKYRDLARKESDKALKELGDNFIEHVISLHLGQDDEQEDNVELDETRLLEPTHLIAQLEKGEKISSEEQTKLAEHYKKKPAHQVLNAALLLSNMQDLDEKTSQHRNTITCRILSGLGEGAISQVKHGRKYYSFPQTPEDMQQKIQEIMNKEEVRNEVLGYVFGAFAKDKQNEIANRLIGQYKHSEIADALRYMAKNATPEKPVSISLRLGINYFTGTGHATVGDLKSISAILSEKNIGGEVVRLILEKLNPIEEPEAASAEEHSQTINSFPEILHAFIQGRDIQEASFEYTGQPTYMLLDSALALSKVKIDKKNTALMERRTHLISSLLDPLGVDLRRDVLKTPDTYSDAIRETSSKELEETIMKIIQHPNIEGEITVFAFKQLTENREMNDLEKCQMVDKLFSWYDNKNLIVSLTGAASSLIVGSSEETYPQEVVRHLIFTLLEKNENKEWTPQILQLVERIDALGFDPEFVATLKTELSERAEGEVNKEKPDPTFADAPEEEAKESTIFSKLEEAEPLFEKIAATGSHAEASKAYSSLISLLSPKEAKISQEGLILELSDLAINTTDAGLAKKALITLLSLPYISPEEYSSRSITSMIISNALEVPTSISNPVIENILFYGSPEELDCVLDMLAERAKKKDPAIDSRGRVRSTYALATEEIISTFSPEVAANILFSRSNEKIIPQEYLLSSLEGLHARDLNQIEEIVLDTLLGYRSTQENALFEASIKYTEEEAALAEEFLFQLGGSQKDRDSSLAEGVRQLSGGKAAKFAIQRFNDSMDIALWETVLKELPGTEVDTLLMESFDSLDTGIRADTINVLFNRKPSIEKAEFFLAQSEAKEGILPTRSASALAEMDFSSFDAKDEFTFLYTMRNHPNSILEEAAGERLQLFLSKNDSVLFSAQALPLSKLCESDNIQSIRELAQAALFSNSRETLEEHHHLFDFENFTLLLGNTEIVVATLATYALAKEMQDDTAFSKTLSKQTAMALEQFKEQENTSAHLRLMLAARSSENEQYIEQLIVPSLASGDEVSNIASKHLFELGKMGIEIALRAAKRENLPDSLSPEMQKRISIKAINVLCKANALEELVSMLGHKNNAIRSTAYTYLGNEPASEEKTKALLKGIASSDPQVCLASLNLIPREKEYLTAVLSLIKGSPAEISCLAAEFAVPLLGTKGLAAFFLNNGISEFTKQRIADAAIEASPNVINELAFHLSNSQELPNALRFFQRMDTLEHFFEFQKNADAEAKTILEGALEKFCYPLAQVSITQDEPTKEKMLLLLTTCTLFDYEGVQEAGRAAIEGADGELMLKAAEDSEDPELLLRASELFLSVGDEKRAAQAALQCRKLPKAESFSSLKEPYQKVLFGKEHSKVEEVASPVEDPSAPPLPYRLVKSVAFQEFVDSNGSFGSTSLFNEFSYAFSNDLEGIFDYGLKAVSELLWVSGHEENIPQMAKMLPTKVEDSIRVEARSLADILVFERYELLERISKGDELFELLLQHAQRRAVEAISSELSPEGAAAAKQKLRLLAEMLEQGLVKEEEFSSLDEYASPMADAVRISPDWSFTQASESLASLRLEMKGSYENLAAALRERRKALCAEDGVSPEQALRDASRMARGHSPEKPKGSPAKAGKVPRDGGTGANNQ